MNNPRSALRFLVVLLGSALLAPLVPAFGQQAETAQPPTGVVQGHVVDESGAVLTTRWRVSLDRLDGEPGQHGYVNAEDAPDATFRFEGLAEGVYRLTLFLDSRWWSLGPTVTVHAGETVSTDVECRMPERSDEFGLTFEGEDGRPFLPPDPAAVRLVGDALPQGIVARGPDPNAISFPAIYSFGLPPEGLYTVELSDAGYEVVEGGTVRVPSSELPVVQLRGTASLELVVTAAEGGEPIDEFEVDAHLTRHGMKNGKPWPVGTNAKPVLMMKHEGGKVVIEHLLAGEYRLDVSAPGFTQAKPSIGELAAGATRTVNVVLERMGSITGLVVDVTGKPVAGVDVGAFRPATQEGASPRMFHTLATDWNIMQPGPWVNSEVVHSETDEHGRFRLDGIDAGTWIVRAYRSPTVDAVLNDVVVGSAGVLNDLELVLPDGGWIDGQLKLPAGSQCENMSALAWQIDGDRAVSFANDEVPVAADGSFRTGPFSPGEVAVWLKVKGGFEPVSMAYTPGQYDPAMHEAGRITLPASGDVVASFDLSAAFPAQVKVSAVIDGQPASGAWVQLFDAKSNAHLATALAGVDGSAQLGPFFATEARAVVADSLGAWFVVSTGTVTPPPGGVGQIEIVAKIAHGTVMLVDAATLEPLREEIVCVYRESPFGWSPGLMRTDASGGLALDLPPTRLRLHYVGQAGEWMMPRDGLVAQHFMSAPPYPLQPDESMPLVEWTSEGPATPQVALKR